MASRSLTVIAQVKDAASAPLKRIADSFDNTNKSIQKSSVNISEFNKAMFATSAFIGLFSKAMGGVVSALTEASQYDRISEQFERVMGPKGDLFKAIDGMTSSSIDRIEAMKSGIALGTLGMVGSTQELAELMARAGTAAKRSGMDSGEGIKHLTDFMKTGEVTNLAFLNVLSAINPELQTQMAILHKAGGVMGGVIGTQARLNMGMAVFKAATQGMKGDARDLMDVVADVKQGFTFLTNTVSTFLGKALTPVLEKIKSLMYGMGDLVERLRKSDPYIVKTARNIILVVTALTAFVAVVGTASLAMKAFAALGIPGLPLLVLGLFGLAASFTDVGASAKGFIDFFKNVGAVLLGTFQLVSSFIGDADNFSKGIGKMDSELHTFLQKQGLLELTKNIARVSAVIITFVKDVGNELIEWFKGAAKFISPVTTSLANLFEVSDPSEWSRKWIESGSNVRDTLVGLAAGAITAFAAFRTLSMARGLVAKIPFVGNMVGKGFGALASVMAGTGAAGAAGAGAAGAAGAAAGTGEAAVALGVGSILSNILSKYLMAPLVGVAALLGETALLILSFPVVIGAAFTAAFAGIGVATGAIINSLIGPLFNKIIIDLITAGGLITGLIKTDASQYAAAYPQDFIPSNTATRNLTLPVSLNQGAYGPNSKSGTFNMINTPAQNPLSSVSDNGFNLVQAPDAHFDNNLKTKIDQATDTGMQRMMRDAMALALTDTISDKFISIEEYSEIMTASANKSDMTKYLKKMQNTNRPTLPTKAARC